MKKYISESINLLNLSFLLFVFINNIKAQNPIVRNQYTADPTARVFGDSVYLYPSHDITCSEVKGRKNWFCMEDYHVFSSANLTDWVDHGVIVSQSNVNWVDSNSYSMWAPDCISKNGKYYFYFPAWPKDTANGRRFSIGVAISDKPNGPFIPQKEPIDNVSGIDPNLFIDKDGQVYMYWSMRNIFAAKLKDNMIELASEPQIVEGLPQKGLKEGPFLFERNGIYYMTYPHVENKIERLEYAIADNPLGPFKFTGVIMDESPTGCWTNHHSITEFKDQWYLFYHQNDLSPHFDKNRSVRIDSLFFNDDGTIQKVTPTNRGVGITDALQKIEIDRYSSKSNTGIDIAFIDTLNKFQGWKAIFNKPDAWIQYNSVDFGNGNIQSAQLQVFSEKGGIVQIRIDRPDGSIISEILIPKNPEWNTISYKILETPKKIHNLVLVLKDSSVVEIDWLRFNTAVIP